MNEVITQVRHKLRLLAISSCGCNTKTPDAQHHDENCGYRLVREADALLANLNHTCGVPPSPSTVPATPGKGAP